MNYKSEIYDEFVRDFSTILRSKIENLEISKLIFLCIGTDKIIGDSFGPLVGYKLNKLFYSESNIEVIGNLKNIVNACNIMQIIDKIKNTYENPFLIAIDSAISNRTQIGRIIVSGSKMNVSSFFMQNKLYVGDVSIKGVVSRNYNNPKMNYKSLQNVPLSIIMNMADYVAQGIYNLINV